MKKVLFAVVPALIIILCVVFIPVINAIGMSFQSYDLRRPNDIAFVGLANYIAAFKDELFWKALWKTILWVVFGVGFQFVFGFILAQEIFEFTGNILGEALADAIAFSSPEAIVLFGGLAKSGDYIMKPIQKSMEDNLLNIYKGKTKLLVSELKDSDAAVLGASALAWELKDLKE